MLTGELKSKIDGVWNDFWSGGISNPLEIVEQLTYLLFIKGLDESHARAEDKAHRTRAPIVDPIFPAGTFTPDGSIHGCPYEALRWRRLKQLDNPRALYDRVANFVFPFIRARAVDTSHAQHMQGARFTIPTPELLIKAVDGLDAIPMSDRDTKGDIYEYMLSKIATAGQNGQFRTPRHIIALMVEMTQPTPTDSVCDPASGTCGFLVAAADYIRRIYPDSFSDRSWLEDFNSKMFSGYDFDNTMLRIGSMNLQLHGLDNPTVEYRDSLSENYAHDREAYSLILANPPFAGSLDYDGTAKDLLRIAKTKKTELLFLALFLQLLRPGGRAAVIVPDGVLFGTTNTHKALRGMLVEEQKLDGVVSLPAGVFKPYAGVSTAILLFTKTDSGGTDDVWFYNLEADGFSLDDKRTPLLDERQLGPITYEELGAENHERSNLPDALARWQQRNGGERDRIRTDQSFCVPKADIVAHDYDLSINRYREITYDETEYLPPSRILEDLSGLEVEIQKGIDDIKAMLK